MKNIYVDDNLKLIPDIEEVGKDYYTYHYQTSLQQHLLRLVWP